MAGCLEKKESTATPTKETKIGGTFENNGSAATPTIRRHINVKVGLCTDPRRPDFWSVIRFKSMGLVV